MIRFTSFRIAALSVLALACAISAAGAQALDYADLVTRMDHLEGTIRDLTGQIEQLQYRNQQLTQQMQRLQEQMQGALPSASAAAPPRSAPQYQAPPSTPTPNAQYSPPPAPPPPVASSSGPDGGRHDAFNPSLNPVAPGVPRPLGTSTAATEPPPVYERPGASSDAPAAATPPRQPGAPLNLSNLPGPQGAGPPAGQLPPPPSANPSAAGTQAALPPANTAKDEFDLGYGYFQRRDYPLAAEAFRILLRKYPSDRLAPEAQYWLGESLFQAQQYHDAAEAFLAVSTKYETTARAPDALLRLGQSLAALGEKEAACASLGEVLRKYPRASLGVKESVSREQKRAHC